MKTFEVTITHNWTQRKFMVTLTDDDLDADDAILRVARVFCKDRGISFRDFAELDIFVQPIGGHA